MPLLRTTEDDASLLALQNRIEALELRVAQLVSSRPDPIDRNEGIMIITGQLHQYVSEYNWGLEPYEEANWAYRDASWQNEPYRNPRTFSVEQLYHAFKTWGDYRYLKR